MHTPNCDFCEHYQDCTVRKALKEARETIFNIGRERAGRKDFVVNGKLIQADKEELE